MANTEGSAEELVKRHAPEVAEQIKRAAEEAWGNEAQFRGNLARARVFEAFAEHLDLHPQPRDERTLIRGRADSVYNRFVIEYKAPGLLSAAKDDKRNTSASNQLRDYIEDLAKIERHKLDRLAGVVTDGCYFIFGRFRSGIWHADNPLPVTSSSTERFLASLYLLSTEKALTADNLVRDFGENSNVARAAVSSLYGALKGSKNPKVKVIYDQWREQFSEVCGYEEGSPKLNIRALAREYAIQDANPNAFQIFFAIHSYYATFIKLIALQVVHYYVAPKLGTALPQVASYSTDRLQRYLKEMERGGIFKQLGISNFLEGDFFGWYLEIWDEAIDKGVRRIVTELANYSLVTLDADPEQTRDLLKKLYQNVMPKQIRHDLGEYYTPDWLAERLLNQLGFTSERDSRLHEKRLLDPACGSGTFLVLAIKRYKDHCADKPIREVDVLRRILSGIVGFDLNPLAVITARTNYLLALGDLLSVPRDFDVNLPVYTCDSILTPSQAEERVGDQFKMMGAEERQYKFKTVVGDFAIPGELVKAQYIDQLASLVEECVDSKYSTDDFKERLLRAFPLVEGTDDLDIQVLEQLYAKIKDLDERAINGIWARIIKNAFAPLFCGEFHYVVGNPPWVGWEHLPDDYRQQLIPLHQNTYLLFPHTGLRARHGSSDIDISTIMAYVSADRYLTTKGRLGFLITQTVFKTSAAKGFRRFQIRNNALLRVTHVDDFVAIKPFEGVANRTSGFVWERGSETTYPIPYTVWRKASRGTSLPDDITLNDVINRTVRRNFVAEPVNPLDKQSPWLTGKPKAIRAIRKNLGISKYVGHKGVDTSGANAIYWLERLQQRQDGMWLITNVVELAKNKAEEVQTAIESDLVYPLLRGKDVSAWRANPELWIIVPQDNNSPDKGYSESALKVDYPKTYGYLNKFRHHLESRAGYMKYLQSAGNPFYSLYDIKSYTFAPAKVVFREQTRLMKAAVVPEYEGKVMIPDHKLVLVACDSTDEAYYLAGAFNSSIVQYTVAAYVIDVQMSTHVLEYIYFPEFNKDDEVHKKLSSLSRNAHHATEIGDEAGVKKLEEGIDEMAAKVWGLTEEELKEIQESLAELR